MRHLFALLLSALSALLYAEPVLIQTPITENENLKLDAFVNGRPLLTINDYHSPHLDSIGPLEHFLFRKAVLLGGLDAQFEDVIMPNSARARASLHDGSVLAGGAAQWHIYYPGVQDRVYESDAVILRGWYEKGLYVAKNRVGSYSIKSIQDLAKLSAVSSKTWEVDWATLSAMKLTGLYSAPLRSLQFKMIDGGRADFTLQDFSALPDLSIEEQGIRLFPIPGVKIALVGTRHFWVYKNHPASRAIFEALQKGLKLMQLRGEIKRALAESGIRNNEVKDWLLLNPE